MRIEHVALWAATPEGLERLREFYVRLFGAQANARYESRYRPGFASHFVTFPGGGARLELMTAPGLPPRAADEAAGWAHLAISLGTRDAVDAFVERAREAGVPVVSGPRTTGDGYYEAVIRDPDGNFIEVTT